MVSASASSSDTSMEPFSVYLQALVRKFMICTHTQHAQHKDPKKAVRQLNNSSQATFNIRDAYHLPEPFFVCDDCGTNILTQVRTDRDTSSTALNDYVAVL